MRQYITGKAGFTRLLAVVLTTSLLGIISCVDEFEKTDARHNLTLSTRAGGTAAEQIPTMRLFNFHHTGGDDKKFYQEVLNLTRTANQVSAQVEAGQWNMALVSTPNGGTIMKPIPNTVMSKVPLYKYEPTYPTNGQTTAAHEIYLDNKLTPVISANTPASMTAQLNRTVAKVDLIIKKTTPNFKLVSANHKIKLHNIPSTISYTGDLLPDATLPDTLSRALEAPVTLVDAGGGAYKGAETISFIIPAHRGDTYTSATPTDMVKLKMDVTLILERTGGTKFAKQEQIDVVAQCNKILQVEITVSDGIEFNTSILNWESVGMASGVGAGYQNWLYVKKDATGNGLSWSDALPDVSTAITKAEALIAAGKTVNGVLVAGGESLVYNEGLDIPANVKVYGGWKGTVGTELASDNINGPYTAPVAARDLSTHKAIVNLGNKTVQLINANSVLDGFVIQGAAAGNASVVTVSNPTAWINAVEIKNNQNTSGTALALSGANTTATNILVSNNTRGVNVGVGAKLVNATIVRNSAASTFAGSLLNSVYWGNADNPTISGTVNYCAFNGNHTNMPAGTNYPMHATNNTAWIVQGSAIPGPHFANVGSDYTALSNRAPMLGRGNEDVFTNAVTNKMPMENLTDINGNLRSHEGIDIGCYEGVGENRGFRFLWNMRDVYVSTKALIESDHPALLFDNSEGAYVEWKVEANPIGNLFTMVSGGDGGADTGKSLGYFKLKSGPTANSGNNDRECGTITFISTNLGAYLPNDTKTVKQTPGTSAVWNEGYAGSFHRWNETEPRYIFGEYPDAYEWSVRIISGHEWIKIDDKARPSNPNNDTEVEETPYGEIINKTGNIVFRIGLKSTLNGPTSAPRYGLLSITKRKKNANGTYSATVGNALFFVRQGEAPDYLYGPDDNRDLSPDKKRPYAKKFAVYNMTDKYGRFGTDGGTDLGKRGGGFVDYPSKQGYFFKFNDTRAWYPDDTGGTVNIGGSSDRNNGAWSTEREICPPGYHTPTEPEFTYSYFLNRPLYHFVAGNADGTTFVWGRLADGYFDKYANVGDETYGTGPNKACNGLLMYNDYNNASVFFPTPDKRTGGSTFSAPNTTGGVTKHIAWYWTSSTKRGTLNTPNKSDPYGTTENYGWCTHSYSDHLGISCTDSNRQHALSVRCVEGNDRTAPPSPTHP